MRPVNVADEIAAAVRILSRHRLGALIVWDPMAVVEGGVLVDALVSRELLVAIFVPEYLNQLHRGAAIIRCDRIERAGVPISCADLVTRAADLAAIVAIAADDDTGGVLIMDRDGRVAVVNRDGLAVALRHREL